MFCGNDLFCGTSVDRVKFITMTRIKLAYTFDCVHNGSQYALT